MFNVDGIVNVLEFKDTCRILIKGFLNSFLGGPKILKGHFGRAVRADIVIVLIVDALRNS